MQLELFPNFTINIFLEFLLEAFFSRWIRRGDLWGELTEINCTAVCFVLQLLKNVRVCTFFSIEISGKLPTYPSLKPTLTLTSHLGQNICLRKRSVGSFPETSLDPYFLRNGQYCQNAVRHWAQLKLNWFSFPVSFFKFIRQQMVTMTALNLCYTGKQILFVGRLDTSS